MHELAVTEDLLKTVLRHAAEADARRVRQVNLVVGDLAGFVGESLEFYWQILGEGTICRGSKLQIERISARFACQACQLEFVMDSELAFCPQCGSHQAKLMAGNEFFLHSIDIDVDE